MSKKRNLRKSGRIMTIRAALVLRHPRSSFLARTLAGSVLSQAAPRDPIASAQRRTSLRMARIASYILRKPGFSDLEQALAGSVLSQRM